MRDLDKIKQRFMKDNLPIQLGGIAANLARIKSFSKTVDNDDVINDLIEESKFFIEWAAPKASIKVQEKLVDLQIQLALINFTRDNKRAGEISGMWAEKILKLSGLLKGD
jgi:hypothetical protein